MPQSKAKHHGFTIVELMVSMSVLALMLFLINSIFNETTAAVTTGIQTSRAIAATRVLDAKLAEDGQAMIGPSQTGAGGYIVIIQELRPTTTMLNPESLGEFESKGIRTDQLVYIRRAEGLRSMTPNGSDSYLSTLVGQNNGYARVWYGHVLRTLNNGEDAGERLGDPGAGLDHIGSDWILGRQAMLFNPLDELENNKPTPRADPTLAGAPNLYMHAENARFDADLGGVGGFPGQKKAFMGVADVTPQRYDQVNATDEEALMYFLTKNEDDLDKQNEYYLATAYPDPDRLLRVNTSPDPETTGYASWSIGQGHGILTPNCSEFVVQFAADLNGNGRIDTRFGGGPDDGSDAANGQAPGIFWYDTFAKNPAGANYPPPIWKPSSLTPADPPNRPNAVPQPLIQQFSNADRRVFIFRADDFRPFTSATEPTSAWPYMIRIRYRLHDSRGRMMSNDPTALYDTYDNDGDGQADDEDPENDEDRISGRWFERIITVPRPKP